MTAAPSSPTGPRPTVEISTGRIATTIFSVMALMLAMAALVVSAGDEDSGAVVQHGAVDNAVPVSLTEFAIAPDPIAAEEGSTLGITNAGAGVHTLAVEGEGLATPELQPLQSAAISLAGLEPGTYKVVCTIPGHEGAGMVGELNIVKAGEATGEPSIHAMSADEMDELMAKATIAFATGTAKTKGVGGQLLAPTVLPDGTKQFELTTEEIDWEVEPGRFVRAMAYNRQVPGPTLKVANGDKLRIVLHNKMTQSTVIHWHGLLTPNSMDGVPDITQAPVKPGASFVYEFVAKGPAVGMYHSHHNAQVQAPNGLAGAILVGDLPLPAGVTVSQELPMMLNDAGTIGLTLNGKSFPATAPMVVKRGEWALVHYLNEGFMAHPMHLHGLEQVVIAKDGFPVTPLPGRHHQRRPR